MRVAICELRANEYGGCSRTRRFDVGGASDVAITTGIPPCLASICCIAGGVAASVSWISRPHATSEGLDREQQRVHFVGLFSKLHIARHGGARRSHVTDVGVTEPGGADTTRGPHQLYAAVAGVAERV